MLPSPQINWFVNKKLVRNEVQSTTGREMGELVETPLHHDKGSSNPLRAEQAIQASPQRDEA